MKREPEENMSLCANRNRKAFHKVYPMDGILDSATAASREQMMMDRFLEGLPSDVQVPLKYKKFASFETLIDRAELTALAIEESQTKVRIHAAYSSTIAPTHQNELTSVLEALNRLSTKDDQNATSHNAELQQSLAEMKRQLAQKPSQVGGRQRDLNVTQPEAFKRAALFCEFHNIWGFHTEQTVSPSFNKRTSFAACAKTKGTDIISALPSGTQDPLHHQGIMPTLQRHQPASCGCRQKTRNHQINCWATRWVPQAPTICQIRVHPSYHPQNWTKNSGAVKSLISSRLFERLRQQMEEFRHEEKGLVCQGTVTVDVFVEDERPREPFQQEFIVVPEIMEECVLGLDALYEHKFMIDGHERRVYRVRESDQLQNDDKPTMMVAVKTKIPPSSACVVESNNSDVKLFLDTACFLVKNPRLPAGLRLDPFVSTKRDNGMFRNVIVNETNHTISLSRYTILGHVVFEPPTLIASCSTKPTTIDPAIFEASLPDVTETIKGELRKLLLENQSIFAFQTRDLGNTGLVKHVIDTQGKGPIRQRPYRASPRQR
ncbi:hypothetical protein OUZ56_005614 [Daphnia magna]|uniref:Uncharacterized protein n=1 Tax=Daphnia magna TaxID=35525 RepID=A0ABQ9YT93_9CRUS|nr:hypothetical protein OUZ56_005614 [Daphnia magna]